MIGRLQSQTQDAVWEGAMICRSVRCGPLLDSGIRVWSEKAAEPGT
jgi:hypothetical protein